MAFSGKPQGNAHLPVDSGAEAIPRREISPAIKSPTKNLSSLSSPERRAILIGPHLHKLPKPNPEMYEQGKVKHLKATLCPNCFQGQPIQRQCPECKKIRDFICFPIRCYRKGVWKGWKCRYCREVTEQIRNIRDPPQTPTDPKMAWLQQEKVKRFQTLLEEHRKNPENKADCPNCRTKLTIQNWTCFNCPQEKHKLITEGSDWIDSRKMDSEWFCAKCRYIYDILPNNVENYCYLCRNPQPIISGKCKGCHQFYRIDCLYPFKCISTMFVEEVGNDRWTHCVDCLSNLEFVDVAEELAKLE